MQIRERMGRVYSLLRFAGFLRRKLTADLVPTLCYGGASRAATNGSIGFQPVILAFAYGQDACSDLLKWSPSAVRAAAIKFSNDTTNKSLSATSFVR